jgi:glyoxylase-like metal-dependent hydrolase (beta-lactamase superfamily II)
MLIKPLPMEFDPDNFYAPPYNVTRWLKDGERIDLGGRILEVIHTPGHSSNHLCILDKQARYLFTGDIYYTGGVTSYLPGGNHHNFVNSCQKLVELMSHYDYLMPAHNEPLVEKEQMKEMYMAARRIRNNSITEYTIHRSVAVNYDLIIRKYQFKRFNLSVRADLFKDPPM